MKLSKRGTVAVKLTLWAGTLTWMVLFFAMGVTIAQRFADIAPEWFGTGKWGQTLTWIAPTWTVFTSLLVCVYVARFVNKKLQPAEDEEEEERLAGEEAVGKLSERDVKAIASSRFSHKWAWKLIGVGVVGLVALLGLSWGTSNYYLPIIPMLIFAVVLVWYVNGLSREQKRAVKKWREERVDE